MRPLRNAEDNKGEAIRNAGNARQWLSDETHQV